MERYITADEAMHELEKVFMPNDFPKIVRAISSTRTAEVRLDVHGRWIKMSDADGVYWACSECGEEIPRVDDFDPQFDLFHRLKSMEKTNYCPHCGAEMAREA